MFSIFTIGGGFTILRPDKYNIYIYFNCINRNLETGPNRFGFTQGFKISCNFDEPLKLPCFKYVIFCRIFLDKTVLPLYWLSERVTNVESSKLVENNILMPFSISTKTYKFIFIAFSKFLFNLTFSVKM